MGYVKKLYDQSLVGAQSTSTEIYPVTSSLAVITDSSISDSSLRGENLSVVINALLTAIANSGGSGGGSGGGGGISNLVGYQLMGIVNPSDIPPTLSDSSQKVFYIASTPGIYENFGNITANRGEITFMLYNSANTPNFTKKTVAIPENFINVGVKDNVTNARLSVPSVNRVQGTVLTYKINNTWYAEQFINEYTQNWLNDQAWQSFGSGSGGGIDSLIGYQYVGFATAQTNPNATGGPGASPTQKVFYLASTGDIVGRDDFSNFLGPNQGPNIGNNKFFALKYQPWEYGVDNSGEWIIEYITLPASIFDIPHFVYNVNALQTEWGDSSYTNKAAPRSRVDTNSRYGGSIIAYKLNGSWIVEQYIGPVNIQAGDNVGRPISAAAWANTDSNWRTISPTQNSSSGSNLDLKVDIVAVTGGRIGIRYHVNTTHMWELQIPAGWMLYRGNEWRPVISNSGDTENPYYIIGSITTPTGVSDDQLTRVLTVTFTNTQPYYATYSFKTLNNVSLDGSEYIMGYFYYTPPISSTSNGTWSASLSIFQGLIAD